MLDHPFIGSQCLYLFIKPCSCEKEELNVQKGFILLGDPFISMIGSDFTQGEVPLHPCLPAGRGGGGPFMFFFINIEVNTDF
jgi:hypothetical protein